MTAPTAAGLPVATGRETRRELWRASRGHRAKILAVALLGLSGASLALVMPVALGRLINAVDTGTADAATVGATVAVMLAATTAGAIGTALTAVLAGRIYQTILAELRERLVANAMVLPRAVVERSGTGDLVARASDDVAQIAEAAHRVVPALTSASFAIVVSVAGMTALDWRYGLTLAATLPVYVLALRWYLATAPQVYRAQRAATGGRAQQILESLRGFDTVQAYGLGDHRHRRVIGASWQVVRHTLRARTVQNMFVGRLHLAEFLGLAGILVTGCLLIGAGQSTVGAATTAMLVFLRLSGPITQLLLVIDVLQSALASLNRIVGVITMPASGADAAATPPPGGAAGRLSGVGFGYPGGPRVLHDVDLTIGPGERVAVVGASGAGKTTLAGVLAGVHTPDSGTVGRAASTLMITQDVHVFAGTLRDNLTLAAPAATDTEIGEALVSTGAAELLELLPDGLDTLVGAAGLPLTAAQAQQVALARVVLADPELAIFDEATAEAGSGYAEQLDRAAEAALAGRAGLVIAHRLSQAAACDRVVVMAGGRVIEVGSHTELVGADGPYARLWRSWRVASDDEPSRTDTSHTDTSHTDASRA
ncbi:ABC transporter ATP-binding protein [Pseudonocardia nematodicida]|uniref:ABC transporter ATP-binding protein n=1 Tax=Pseudonocardia nematodicida TaxID=1206997 RepID=A0ABV1KGE4_9PSEU